MNTLIFFPVWFFTTFLFLGPDFCGVAVANKSGGGGGGASASEIQTFEDQKALKKFLRTRVNVLALFAAGGKEEAAAAATLLTVAKEVKGIASIIKINCATKEGKKLCKKYKVPSKTRQLKHFKEGVFHKDYDRQETFQSLVNFLKNPTGDMAWKEDETAKDVHHIENEQGLKKFLRKTSSTPALVMFYAPWCGHCKSLKPDFAAAATELKGKSLLAGMDVDNHSDIRERYNITGFPTLLYFEGGEVKFPFGGGRPSKDSILEWIKSPTPPKAPEPVVEWNQEPGDVVHLTDDNFEPFLIEHASVFVMFYAPWCGHCKTLKPEYTAAAAELKAADVTGVLAALDATKHRRAAETQTISGYPTMKYFKNGEFAFEKSVRTKDEIVSFMKNPQAPPPPPPPEPDWTEEEGSEVVHLGEDDFQSVLKKRKHSLVMFYAPWCGHCKRAKPHMTAAAAKLASTKGLSRGCLAAVDCTKHDALCARFEVKGYPTFRYFNYGKNSKPYEGGREEEDFLAFMEDPANPKVAKSEQQREEKKVDFWQSVDGAEHVERIVDEAAFDNFVVTHSSVLVMFFAPWCGHCTAMKPAYAAAAATLQLAESNGRLVAVDATAAPAIAAKFDVRGYPTIKHFADGAVSADEYHAGRDADSIVEFMRRVDAETPTRKKEEEPSTSTPPTREAGAWNDAPDDVVVLNADNFYAFLAANDAAFVIFYAPWCGYCKKMKPAFFAAATILKDLKPEVRLAAVEATQNRALAEDLKIRGYPTLKLFLGGRTLDYEGGRSAEELVDYVSKINVKDEL